jgi:hypothetical protein
MSCIRRTNVRIKGLHRQGFEKTDRCFALQIAFCGEFMSVGLFAGKDRLESLDVYPRGDSIRI